VHPHAGVRIPLPASSDLDGTYTELYRSQDEL